MKQQDFEKQIDKAYDILWALYKPKNNAEDGNDLDSMQDSLVLSMLNHIDDLTRLSTLTQRRSDNG